MQHYIDINNLPNELIDEILEYVPVHERDRSRYVSQQFRNSRLSNPLKYEEVKNIIGEDLQNENYKHIIELINIYWEIYQEQFKNDLDNPIGMTLTNNSQNPNMEIIKWYFENIPYQDFVDFEDLLYLLLVTSFKTQNELLFYYIWNLIPDYLYEDLIYDIKEYYREVSRKENNIKIIRFMEKIFIRLDIDLN